MPSFSIVKSVVGLLGAIPIAIAGFTPSSSSNIAIYWGQNSYNQASGPLAQQRLSYYCANTEVNIIPLAFLTVIGAPALNFASAGDKCTVISGSNLFYCSELEEDIPACQTTYGKTILLSVGGATYTEGGFSSESAAVAAANNLWSIFGPSSGSSVPRPFGKAAIDGFDFDFETTVTNMPAFGIQLRSLMDANTASTGKQWLLTAAPQCPYPDLADGPMLAGTVFFDIVWVQFYNNYCGASSFTAGSSTQTEFNFGTWDNWAKTVSLNPNVKVMLGVPGNTGAGGGYLSASALAPVIAYSKGFSSFGGIMIWDMSQTWANSGFLDGVARALGVSPTTTFATSRPATTFATMTTQQTSAVETKVVAPTNTPGSATGTVGQWNQCGGQDWNGATICTSPYTCVYMSMWYSQCK